MFGEPAQHCDAANFITSWNPVTAETIKNFFGKADLGLNIESGESEMERLDLLVKEFSKLYLNFTEDDINRFLCIDDRNSQKYCDAIFDKNKRCWFIF